MLMHLKQQRRVVVLGLDGASLKLIKAWVAGGGLPNFDRIITGGASGELKSTIPPKSAPAWASFMTGKNPGKHGVFDFTYHRPDCYDLFFVNSRTMKAESLWRILSEAGKRVGVLNVPMTYPPEEVNGFLICGQGSPSVSDKFAFPPGICQELLKNVRDYQLEPHVRDYIRRKAFDQFFEALMDSLNKRISAAEYFMKKESWDLFMVVFGEVDRIQHFYWKYMDPHHPLYNQEESERYGKCIFRIYEAIDDMIGRLLPGLDEDTNLILVSDHGHGGSNNKALYLNNWLAHIGLLRMKNRQSVNKGIMTKAILFGKRFIPRDYKNRLKASNKVRSKVETLTRRSAIDWTRTKAYSDEPMGHIWINLKGREAGGIVEKSSEYEKLRDLIIDKLKDLRDPETNETIFGRVYKREDVYQGPYVDRAPDILFLQREDRYQYTYRKSNSVGQNVFLRTFTPAELADDLKPNANHRMMGIFVARGIDIRRGAGILGSQIIDIAPTILYLMGVPIPEDMDGRVLTGAIEDSFLEKNPPGYCQSDGTAVSGTDDPVYSKEEQKEIEEALKGLGYI